MSEVKPLQGAQAQASAPDGHVWLSASAGTGKTHVLTARVLRLLLSGASPESILCLTFTKAGATEMAVRIHERLASWVQMDERRLFEELEALGEAGGPEQRETARTLFATVLEATGGGLRIQTIHAFCQQLLSAFPLEAGLVPGFRPLEDREQAELARETLAELVVRAEEEGDDGLIAALQAMALRLGEEASEAYLVACARADGAFAQIDAEMRNWLFDQLDLPQGDVEQLIAQACCDDAFDMAALAALAGANARWDTAMGRGFIATIGAWVAAPPAERAEGLAELSLVVLTAKGEPRKAKPGQIKAEHDYAELAMGVGQRCAELLRLRAMVGFAGFLAQALEAGRAFARAYAQAKKHAGVLDYDDLIARCAGLLHMDGMAAWIRFKLDQRIDHVLIDEAQDSNDRQWRIVRALTDEFFAGEGAKGERLRTVFAVGDFKQAIYGFQGTSPRAFAAARAEFRTLAEGAGQAFLDLALDRSFRSTPAVLDFVDATIGEVGPDALGLEEEAGAHVSNRPHPGQVMLWRPVEAVGAEDDENGDGETGEEEWQAEHARVLAERIAGQIGAWLDSGAMLASQGRAVRPGDIMVLVRRRGDLARLLIARLYEAGIEVAGIDRIRLSAPLAIMDLMAALRFAAQPDDDLNLASLLVSPLIGWSQQDLLDRAVPREGSLWRHLRAHRDLPGVDLLFDILARADFVTPYRFLEHLLSGPVQARRKLIARLGEQVRDPVDELLQAALALEEDGRASLQHFIDWFDRDEGDIKREAEGRGDAVRILTVHGAKGLQAPVVILADATFDPILERGASYLDWPVTADDSLPLLTPRKAEAGGIFAAAMAQKQARNLQEHWRLFYVALTRAEEWLCMAGSLGSRARGVVPAHSWFALAERAMGALGAGWEPDLLWGGQARWSGPPDLAPVTAKAADDAVSAEPDLPDWLGRPAPAEARPSRPLTPTAPGEDESVRAPPTPAMRDAARRGQWLHALFERLPAVPAGERRAAADHWLTRAYGLDDARARADLIDHALGIMEAPEFAALFAPDALAEAPIAAVVGEDVIAGTVDRLLVGAEQVQVIDFKTGQAAPSAPAQIPPAHLRQMAAYVAALACIFPDRRIEAALLYTAGPVIFRLDAALLAPYKPGLARAQQ